MRSLTALSLVCCAWIPSAAKADRYILAADSVNARIALLSAADGSLINANFIVDGAGVGYDLQSPRNAMRVGNEIWVSDQVADSIFRFSLGGKWTGTITGQLDNLRGMELIGNVVYVANAGSNNGAPGPSVVQFSTDGTRLGHLSTSALGTSPSDVLANGATWLVSDLGADSISRFDDAGLVGGFVNSTPTNILIKAPQQMARRTDGSILVAGLNTTSGVYLFDATGQFVQRFATGRAPNGVIELDNGKFAYSRSDGFYGLDPVTDLSTAILTGGGTRGQYLEFATLPEPGVMLGVATLAAASLVRSRRM